MTDDISKRIERTKEFKEKLVEWQRSRHGKLREWLNQNRNWVEREVVEAGCHKTLIITPPPAIGGLVMRNVNPFNYMFEGPYMMSMVPTICDMLDQTIGVLLNPMPEPKGAPEPIIEAQIQPGYAFVAMPMDEDNHLLVDVLEAIKTAASDCGITAARIDDDQRSERITDRILESIRKAQFVIVDITHERPNVFWEAGYAHGIGKTPIYIARQGTGRQFDIQDYPIIYFRHMQELKEKLTQRLQGIAEQR